MTKEIWWRRRESNPVQRVSTTSRDRSKTPGKQGSFASGHYDSGALSTHLEPASSTPSGTAQAQPPDVPRRVRCSPKTSSLGRSLATPQPLGNPVFSGGYVGAVYPGMSRSATQSGFAGGVTMWATPTTEGKQHTATGRESGSDGTG